MIIVVCVDDLSIGKTAFKTAFGPEGWDRIHTRSKNDSGHVPIMWDTKTILGKISIKSETVEAMLEQDENLIVTAHGNRREIGNEGGAQAEYNIDAFNLALKLSNLVLPKGYSGNIYLSACQSWYYGKFFKNMLLHLRPNYSGKIYGYNFSPDSDLDPLDADYYKKV